ISSTTSTVWNAIKNFLSTCWNGLVSFVMPIFNRIKDFIVSVWNTISSTTSTIWNTIKNVLSSIWNSIVSVVTPIFNSIKSAISTVWNAISSTSSSVWNGIKSTLSSIWEGIKSTASSVWNGLKEAIMTPVRWVTSAVEGAFNGMKSAVLGVWDGIKSGIRTVINGIIKMINKFIDGFNTPANLLNKIPGADAPTIPHVPMLAKGGHVLGDGQFIAGEAGPELFSKKGNKVSVTPLSSSEKEAGIGGQLNLLTRNVAETIQNAAAQLAQIVAFDVPNALGDALLNGLPNIAGTTTGEGSNHQPIEVNFYNTVRDERDIDRMFEKADDWFAQKGRNLNIGIGRN
ncbi:phage tail protein, partial [Bacillus pseudomycoides]